MGGDVQWERRSRFFKTYMHKTFPEFKLQDGEYLFVIPSGCRGCNEHVLNYLADHPDVIAGKYQAVLFSADTKRLIPASAFSKVQNVLCDNTNKLDRMDFGIDGVAILKIQNKRIVAYKCFAVNDVKGDVKDFFISIP